MSRDCIVPFYTVGDDNIKFGRVSIDNFNQAFCAASAKDAVALQLASLEIAASCSNGFSVRTKKVDFPFFDEERQMTFWPQMTLHFIGASRNIELAVKAVEIAAEEPRGSYDDSEFSFCDLNAEAVGFDKRARFIRQMTGIPAGAVDRKNSAFIVSTETACYQIAEALPGMRIE